MQRSAATATRLSCFAIITSIETDLRNLVVAICFREGVTAFLPDDVRRNAIQRKNKDERASNFDRGSDDDESLIEYSDFSDIGKLIHKHRGLFEIKERDNATKIADAIIDANPARARVCHSRPLEPEDYPGLVDLAKFCIETLNAIALTNTNQALFSLENSPAFVFSQNIPDFWNNESPQVSNNLPIPEFDDTGFLGRSNDRAAMLKHINSAYPVISILGEGGVGKTSLALRCAYDLVGNPDSCAFEYVVWVSLKTTKLTHAGIQPIQNAISSATHLWQELSSQLGTPAASEKETEGLFSEIYEYLSTFKILLVLDNCETVSKQDLLDFLSGIPIGSKVLITSRLGLGAIEFPYPLDAMLSKDCSKLFRVYAALLNDQSLAKSQQVQIDSYVKKLYNNPLAIKWFVASTTHGSDPKKLLGKKERSFSEILDFCFSNVFECFTNEQTSVVNTLLCAGRPLSATELIIVLDKSDRDEIELALSTLHHTSVIRRHLQSEGSDDQETVYQIGDFAQQYIRRQSPPTSDFRRLITDRLRELKAIERSSSKRQIAYKYEQFSVRSANRSERIIASELNRVLELSKLNDYSAALDQISNLERRFPTSSEMLRVKALILTAKGETFEAEQAYEDAILADETSEIARYSFALFLLNEFNDPERALSEAQKLSELDSTHFAAQALLATCLARSGNFGPATQQYDRVLKTWKDQPPRIALVNHDQASECWRKWASTDRSHRDAVGFRTHIQGAMNILAAALSRGLKDSKLIVRIERLTSEAVAGAIYFDDAELAIKILKFLEEIKGYLFRIIDIQSLNEFENQFKDVPGFGHAAGGLPIAESRGPIPFKKVQHSTLEASSDEVTEGLVVKFFPDKFFGFLLLDSGEELFFHKGSAANEAVWDDLYLGASVTFRIGESRQGLCAMNMAFPST